MQVSAAILPPPATTPLHRAGRWLIYTGLTLAGLTGYGCGVSCTRPRPLPEPSGQLVTAPLPAGLPTARACCS